MNSLDTSGIITKLWQRDFYEHIIRDDEDYNRIYNYIQDNPADWSADDENPANSKQEQRR